MDALATTHDRVGDDVLFLSVTSEPVGDTISEAELAEWWDENDGDWTIGLDPTSELTSRYWGSPYPSAVAIDASGPSGGTIPASKPPTNSSRESNAPLEGGAE